MSTDKYSDVWPIFFYLKNFYWDDCFLQTYLVTETKNFNQNEVTTIQKPYADWSTVLKTALNEIPHNYVLFILDDMSSRIKRT